MSDVLVLGRDAIGAVAESDGMRYYLTDCCGASAKGLEDYVGCRACYQEIDPALGDLPDSKTVLVKELPADGRGIRDDTFGGWWVFQPVPLELTEIYGDGIPYDDWKAKVFA